MFMIVLLISSIIAFARSGVGTNCHNSVLLQPNLKIFNVLIYLISRIGENMLVQMITLNLFWKKRRLPSEIEYYKTKDTEFLAGVTSLFESISDISGLSESGGSPGVKRNNMSTASIHSSYSHQENIYERLPN
jgi:hypothetical protein